MCQDFGRKGLESVYKRVIPRLAKRAEGSPTRRLRYASNGGCQSGVVAIPLRKPATAAAMHHPSTFDRRALIRYVTEPAIGRSLAVCAARDDPHLNATRRFEVEDFAKQILCTSHSSASP